MDWHIILFGIVFVTIFAWAWYREKVRVKHLKETGIRTTGLVLKNKICWGRITVVRPIIKFQTAEAGTIEALDKNGIAMAIPRFTKGEEVQLIYDPSDPTNFTIISNGNW